MMKRYEVIERKIWRHESGRVAAIYGAVPWTSETEKLQWRMESAGWTIRDSKIGTVGQPWGLQRLREHGLDDYQHVLELALSLEKRFNA